MLESRFRFLLNIGSCLFISVKVVYFLKYKSLSCDKEGRHPVLLAGDALRLCFHLLSTGPTIAPL